MPHGDFASLPRGSESKASFATGVEDALVLCKGDALARSEAEAACGLMELSTGVTVPQSYVDQLASMYLRGVPDDPREVNALQASWEQHLEKVKERKQAADVRAETVMRKVVRELGSSVGYRGDNLVRDGEKRTRKPSFRVGQ